ncbi:MAG: DUF86 domain-containing protein [Planctomycetes bacterium]|nr:DUF86 domain-containing protein [Planctomycetota bacterium]
MNDIVIDKIQSIERCVGRAREEHSAAGENFASDHTRQDAAVLNVTRACEQSIDLTNHLVKILSLGIPSSSAESFALIEQAGVIDAELAEKLKRMASFRNIAIHAYHKLDVEILEKVIVTYLDDLLEFTMNVAKFLQK